MKKKKVIILGAAGRDFHDFNAVFRSDPSYSVVAFTATQIPYIAERKYPPELSGKLYPKGIPIFEEKELPELIRKYKVDECVFSYSDVSHEEVMHKASIVLANGARFSLLGPRENMLKSKKPVISVCAVRTGSGKSQVSRFVRNTLAEMGKKVVVVRHPMPYGDLRKQICQRFATFQDLIDQNCTIEEREEYEPHIRKGAIVYAGVDYEKILRKAEKEADIIIWDGGNNDYPFFRPDLHIVVLDPLRAGHELKYHPGETNFRMADVLVINKIDTAEAKNVKTILENIKKINPAAKVIKAHSKITADKPENIRGKKVLIIEDGPTVTHGEMPFGAGYVAAKQHKAKSITDPREFAKGSLAKIFKKFPHLKRVLPAMGYRKEQIEELQKTINSADCDTVIIGTPIDLTKIMHIDKNVARITYELKELPPYKFKNILNNFIKKQRK